MEPTAPAVSVRDPLFAAPFLALQSQRFALDPPVLRALPRQVLPPPDDDAWQRDTPEALLRRTRNREWLRIAARALPAAPGAAPLAPLEETLADLSDFADAALVAAIAQAEHKLLPRFGTPRGDDGALSKLLVLGMGKLGGRELNFSSDIDLIAGYTAAGETDGAKRLGNGEYFVKLVQEVVRLLATPTEDGFAFRVDLMLRPFGSASPIAIGADAMEDYYQAHGREWERYALVKARAVAGDLAAGDALLAQLRPFVYRRYLDYDAIASLRDLKARIAADAATRGVANDDLKVGHGGIRECEFIVQSFQLVRGGHDARLRQRGWADTLAVLRAQSLLEGADTDALHAAYTLLRRTENAVQIWADAQTHALPHEPERRAWLAAALGFGDAQAFDAELRRHRDFVAERFASLFATSEASGSATTCAAVTAAFHGGGNGTDMGAAAASAGTDGKAAHAGSLEALALAGLPEAAREPVRAALATLSTAPALRLAGEKTQARLAALLPLLLEDALALAAAPPAVAIAAGAAAEVGSAPVSTSVSVSASASASASLSVAAPASMPSSSRLDAGNAFVRALSVVGAVLGRSTYLTLLRESAAARRNLLAVVAASPAISDELARHPVLLDQLLDARTLYTPPRRAPFREELLPRLAALAPDDVEQAMDLLRRHAREARLRIACASAVQGLPLVKVSDGLTWLAEAVLEGAIAFAWRGMVRRHGVPHRPDAAATTTPARFAAIGYGKLGALEMGFGSDLDLVFLHDAAPPDTDTQLDATAAPDARPLAQSAWLARLAQKALGLLTTRTHLGRAYEVDLQLRPNGNAGLPVVTLDGYAAYQREQAWTWEHQALTRARFVAGDLALGEAFTRLRLEILCRPRERTDLTAEIGAMREKMRAHAPRAKPKRWDVKHGRGGLIDVEFLVAEAVLAHAHAHPTVAEWPDVWRQIEALVAAGVLVAEDGRALLDAQRAYRGALHERTLQELPGDAGEDEFAAERAAVQALWARTFGAAP